MVARWQQGARVIAITARELGVGQVLGDMGPGAMANAVFEAGLSTHRFLQGSISHAQYRDELGGAALRATTATYCGMAGQLLIPVPVVGAAVGAITGYVAAAVLVESGVLGIGANNIVAVAEERRRQRGARMCRSHPSDAALPKGARRTGGRLPPGLPANL